MRATRLLIQPGTLRRPDAYLIGGWVLIVVAMVGAALIAAFATREPTVSQSARAEAGDQKPQNRYLGTIVSRAFQQDICTEYQFDNETGAFVNRGPIACVDYTPAERFSDTLEYRRFKSVKNAFGGSSR